MWAVAVEGCWVAIVMWGKALTRKNRTRSGSKDTGVEKKSGTEKGVWETSKGEQDVIEKEEKRRTGRGLWQWKTRGKDGRLRRR